MHLKSTKDTMGEKARHIAISTKEPIGANAIAKARGDVDHIVEQCGYSRIMLGSRSPIGFARVLKRYWDVYTIKYRLRPTDTVFLQFPWIHHNKAEFYGGLFGSGAKVHCIVHDIDSIRHNDSEFDNELHDLGKCSTIIAHTPAMKGFLINQGIDGAKIKLLGIFPYLTDDPIHDIKPTDTPTVVFAGNLEKSPFVNRLAEIASHTLHFNIYGKKPQGFHETEYVRLCGTFTPDHPGTISGQWGLVWNGPELETCSGLFGSYLRYNASHQVSMSLALGMPVIVWRESALRDFVVDNNVGIAVGSLLELDEALHSLTPAETEAMLQSTRRMAREIRSGDNLRRLIQAI